MLTESIKIEENKAIINLKGDLDAYSQVQFKDFLDEKIAPMTCDLTFDFKDLEYIDSTGLGIFINIYKDQEEKGKEIKIINAKDNIYKLFKITDLLSLFGMEK